MRKLIGLCQNRPNWRYFRLDESLRVFKEVVCDTPYFKNSAIILFLNKSGMLTSSSITNLMQICFERGSKQTLWLIIWKEFPRKMGRILTQQFSLLERSFMISCPRQWRCERMSLHWYQSNTLLGTLLVLYIRRIASVYLKRSRRRF